MNQQLRKILGAIFLCVLSAQAWSAPAKPVVSLTAPTSGATFSAGANILLSANASESGGTISKVDFYRGGTTLIGTATTSPYTVTWSNATAGSYSLTAKATDSKGRATTSTAVSITVTANVPPTVTLTAPNNNSVFTSGSNITLSATASDPDDTIASVQFYSGATLVGSSTSAPYSVTWSNVAAGNYTLTAKATDSRGAATTSSAATVVVANPPLVVVTSPLMCASTYAPNTITIRADAASPQGAIAKVDFFQGTTLLGTSMVAPYSYTWANVGAGTYAFTARATDANGLVTTSRAVTYTVANDIAPSVSLTSPIANAELSTATAITVAATASDSDGSVAKVDFYESGNLIGTATAGPFSIAWTPNLAGNFSLTAVATDNLGLATTSAAIPISVVSDFPPNISVTAPTGGANVALNTIVAVSANATDPDGSITRVDFYANGSLIGSATAAPYAVNWTPSVLGNVSLTAVATDNVGLQTTSAPIQVNAVYGHPAPTIVLNVSTDTNPAYAPSIVHLTASAAATTGFNVSTIAFYNNNTLIGAGTASLMDWLAHASGSYSLTAMATDNAGETGTSVPVTITLNPSTVTYIHTDFLGSPIVGTSESGSVAWKAHYAPFGERLDSNTTERLGYTGQPLDTESQLAYHGARYYDSTIGRFYGIDPVDVKPGNIYSFNRYSYADNNPYRNADPNGLYTCDGYVEGCPQASQGILMLGQAALAFPAGSWQRTMIENDLTYLEGDNVTIRILNPNLGGGGDGWGSAGHYADKDVIKLSLNGDSGINDAAAERSIPPEVMIAATVAHEINHIDDQTNFGWSQNSLEERMSELKSARAEATVYEGLNTSAPWDTWTTDGGYDSSAVNAEADAATQSWCADGGTCP